MIAGSSSSDDTGKECTDNSVRLDLFSLIYQGSAGKMANMLLFVQFLKQFNNCRFY